MTTVGRVGVRQAQRAARRRVRCERLETALVIAVAALVLVKGAPAVAGVALGMVEMMMAVSPFQKPSRQAGAGTAWLNRPPTRIGSTRVASPVRSSVST